ncbi:hypothetical protein ARMSODRAFT_973609 [Armillaria solidipes]|uniref:Uncharacterized protein n=1 Tax=Armillaria solidipes TaxID=1076256 RepID=A0A2H3C781_9AGAR|nr:hypothetical protein ARMSODRAFT_973609 [Armillaria solidipes]
MHVMLDLDSESEIQLRTSWTSQYQHQHLPVWQRKLVPSFFYWAVGQKATGSSLLYEVQDDKMASLTETMILRCHRSLVVFSRRRPVLPAFKFNLNCVCVFIVFSVLFIVANNDPADYGKDGMGKVGWGSRAVKSFFDVVYQSPIPAPPWIWKRHDKGPGSHSWKSKYDQAVGVHKELLNKEVKERYGQFKRQTQQHYSSEQQFSWTVYGILRMAPVFIDEVEHLLK